MDIRRTVDEIAALVGGRVEGDGARRVEALRGLGRAGPGDMAVVFRDAWLGRARVSRAGCLVVAEDSDLAASDRRSLVRVGAPDAAVERLVAAFAPRPPGWEAGVHPAAFVEPGAEIDASASVGPAAYVGAGARVGARTRLDHAVHVGPGARIGCDGHLHPGVVVGHGCELGDRVVIHAGTVLGADGFGFRPDADGHLAKVAQVGTVIIEDDVEIGANCTVDRARFDATVVGRNSKLDSQVLIAHNVVIGPDCALAGNVAVAGSVSIGAGVMMGGRSGVTDGVTIGERALIGGCAFVTKDVPARSYVAGVPARPHRSWLRETAALRRLPGLLDRARALGPAEADDGP